MGTAGIAVTLYAAGVAATAGTSVEGGNVGVAGITGIAVAPDGVEVAETGGVGVSVTTGAFEPEPVQAIRTVTANNVINAREHLRTPRLCS